MNHSTASTLAPTESIPENTLKKILICAILANGEPISLDRLQNLFEENTIHSTQIKNILQEPDFQIMLSQHGLILKEIASGYCLQVDPEFQPYIAKLFEKRPVKYSRALLETLALVAYRQPITRAEIEDIRGVAVSSHIFKILMEREWVRVIGHKDVPGKPALYATTKQFLDYFNLKSLQDLPCLINFTEDTSNQNLLDNLSDSQETTEMNSENNLSENNPMIAQVTFQEIIEEKSSAEMVEETIA